MKSKLGEKLKFKLEPVAIYFTDSRPENAFQFKPGVRGCAASMLVAAAAKGTVSVFDEQTYGCPGGGVGLCFGNAFEANGHPTQALLSTGDEALAQMGMSHTRSLGRGERFFATPELAEKWKQAVPYTRSKDTYVVFKPLHKVEEGKTPDLICIFANPDQLSALVTLSGFYRGTALNAVAPFASACQSILLARQECEKEMPNAILGFFDLSQRDYLPRELLSFTVPFSMFQELERGVPEGCLTTPAWERLEGRL